MRMGLTPLDLVPKTATPPVGITAGTPTLWCVTSMSRSYRGATSERGGVGRVVEVVGVAALVHPARVIARANDTKARDLIVLMVS